LGYTGVGVRGIPEVGVGRYLRGAAGFSLKNILIPKRSKNAPMMGIKTIGTTLCRDELYPAARAEVPLV
jgi:hypothetical protein